MASPVSFNGEIDWECPICRFVMSKEIFQCVNGHSMCSLCINKVELCPNCRVDVRGNKIRNLLAEKLLDSMKFKCCWEKCMEQFSRGEISEHEAKCPHNPTGIKLFSFIHPYHNCNFHFAMESLEDASKVEQFIEHMKTHQWNETRMGLGKIFKSPLSFGCLKSINSAKKYNKGNRFLRTIFSLDHNNKKHMFLNLLRIYANSDGEEVLSILFVQLTPNFALETSPFKFKLSISTNPGADVTSNWGPDCPATTTWTIKPMKLNKFMEVCELPATQQPLLPFPMSMSTLKTQYANADGAIQYKFFIITD